MRTPNRRITAQSLRRAAVTPAAPIACAIILATQVGCGSGDGSGASIEPVVRDSAGITIVEQPARLADGPEWRTDFAGALPLPGDYHQVNGMTRFSDGTIVVANAGDRQLRYHDAAGRPTVTIGRAGEGPGEFQALSMARRWPGDSIVVFDLQLRRLTLFDAEGTLIRTFGLTTTDEVPFGNVHGVLADGTLIATGFTRTPQGSPEAGRQRYPSAIHSYAADGTAPTPIGADLHGEAFFDLFDGGGFRVWSPPFARSEQILAGTDAIVLGVPDTGEARFHAPNGALLRIVRGIGGPLRPVTPELHRAEIERVVTTSTALTEDDRRRIVSAMEIPETLPAFGELRIDRLGYLWVASYRPPTSTSSDGSGGEAADAPNETVRWRVFDSGGRLAAHVDLPVSFTPNEIGSDYLLGVMRDTFGVETPLLVSLDRGD